MLPVLSARWGDTSSDHFWERREGLDQQELPHPELLAASHGLMWSASMGWRTFGHSRALVTGRLRGGQPRLRPPAGPAPALVYLPKRVPGSQATMRQALDTIARLLTTGGRFEGDELAGGVLDHLSMLWQRVNCAHAAAV